MLSKVHHDNIVVLLGYCLHPTLFIAMEFVDGGTLEDFLGQLTAPKAPAFWRGRLTQRFLACVMGAATVAAAVAAAAAAKH